jgi:hypothetical protein
MAILISDKGGGSNWYTPDGRPAHRILRSDKKGDRPTTLKDAKTHGFLPSVTGILGTLAKPGLENWKMEQVALATQRTLKQPDESNEYWCSRVIAAAFEQVEQAADLGTRIHGALEAAMAGGPYDPALQVYVQPVLDWKAATDIRIVDREVRVVNKAEGFAGTADVLFRYRENGIGILDYKTRKTQAGKPVQAYDNQAMQLAAYAATYWGPENIDRVLAANVFISTTEPGRMAVVEHKFLPKDWEAFRLVAALWRYQKDYDPRVHPATVTP